ncbi:MAG: hypothetical protein COA99_06855 [Moraxellaceae bacterium]|nr:MAG: hypothetical protein COA99_06855 [Moraxellaceae bacterium]
MQADLATAAINFPVNDTTLSHLVHAQQSGQSCVPILQRCSGLELAGLCVLDSVSKSMAKAGTVQSSIVETSIDKTKHKQQIQLNKLERALGVVADDIAEQGDSAKRAVISRVRQADWAQIVALLPSLPIQLMNADDVSDNAQLSEQGVFDSAAQQHREYEDQEPLYRTKNTTYNFNIVGIKQHDEQDILIHELARNPEESLSLQGVAGCGKTTLVARISHLFNEYSTLYLTKNMDQIKAIAPKLGKSIKSWTFDYLAHYILYYKWSGKSYWGRRLELRPDHTKLRPLSYHQIAGIINAVPMNGYTAETVAKIIDRTVTNYCASADIDIGPQHCPWQVDNLSPTLYVELAKTYWKAIKNPDPGSNIPILGIHQIKLVEENQLAIPANFNYVIVDESHDLTGSMAAIIKRSPQAIIALGDRFQITDSKAICRPGQNGTLTPPLEGPVVRDRHLFQSMRAGSNVDSVFNEVLSKHVAIELPGEFHGVSARNTTITAYTEFTPPDSPCAMLSRDYWYAFIAIVQLAQANRPFVVMPATLRTLQSLIPQSLSYLHGYQTQRSHSQLMGYDSWAELVENTGANNGLADTAAFFRKGFTSAQFTQLLSRQTRVYTPDCYSDCYYVGLVSESKSKEMSRVMLAPDVFDEHILQKKEQRTRMLNVIYTGMSRALDEIILPKKESEWLLES